jgi:hypothetical protein
VGGRGPRSIRLLPRSRQELIAERIAHRSNVLRPIQRSRLDLAPDASRGWDARPALAKSCGGLKAGLQYVDAIAEGGEDFYRVVCEHDLEGIVAKPKYGVYYTDGRRTNWLKIKNPSYSQIVGRHEMFEPRSRVGRREPRFPLPSGEPLSAIG